MNPERHKKSSMADAYCIFKNSEMIRLYKGMSKDEVIKLLGNDYWVELCMLPQNEKLVYRFSTGNVHYKILFAHNQLEWVIRGTTFYNSIVEKVG